MGCSLYDEAVYTRCNETIQKARCNEFHYVYLGNYAQGSHVIMVPTLPARGIEDIMDNAFNTTLKTAALWQHFWQESTSTPPTTGGSGNAGFADAEGALVINTPWYREYHQMHIHGGVRNANFDACVQKMTYSSKWQSMQCTGLTGGGGATKADLYFRVVTGLAGVWDTYKDGMLNAGVGNSAGIKALPSQADWKFHVGVIVTRTSVAKVLRDGQYFVILYAPLAKEDKIGRGHFLK